MSLIYLLSSLPMLNLGVEPGIKQTGFIEMCREQLDAADVQVIESLLKGETPDHPFAHEWQDRMTILRNAVAYKRAQRSGTDEEPWLRYTHRVEVWIENLVEEAFQNSDPLQREKELDRICWTILNELQGPDPLCKNAIFAYAIKLRILARQAEWDTKTGTEHFEQLAEIRPADGAEGTLQPES